MKIFNKANLLYWLSAIMCSLLTLEKARADIAVVVHRSNHAELKRHDIEKLFLMKSFFFPDGNRATPYELNQPRLKLSFIEAVIKKTPEEFNSYWTRILFTTSIKPPQQLKTISDLKLILKQSIDAIAYIDLKDVDQSMRVALTIKTQP